MSILSVSSSSSSSVAVGFCNSHIHALPNASFLTQLPLPLVGAHPANDQKNKKKQKRSAAAIGGGVMATKLTVLRTPRTLFFDELLKHSSFQGFIPLNYLLHSRYLFAHFILIALCSTLSPLRSWCFTIESIVHVIL